MTPLWPRIAEKQEDPRHRSFGKSRQHIAHLSVRDARVGQIGRPTPRLADTIVLPFDAEDIPARLCRGQPGEKNAVAATEIEDKGLRFGK
jgi:hypothetical protein